MSRRVGEYFKQRRLEKGLSIVQLAEAVGLTSSNKDARRIGAFEQSGRTTPDLFARLMVALDVDQATLKRLAYEDYKEWLSSLNTPLCPYLVLRALNGGPIRIPDYVQSVSGMELYAILLAATFQGDVGLIVTPRIKIWFTSEGEIREIIEEVPERR